jgi:hypothetical protein
MHTNTKFAHRQDNKMQVGTLLYCFSVTVLFFTFIRKFVEAKTMKSLFLVGLDYF